MLIAAGFGPLWQKLINRHEMLRAIIRDDGLQQILPHTPSYDISHLDLRDANQSTAGLKLAAVERDRRRFRRSHKRCARQS